MCDGRTLSTVLNTQQVPVRLEVVQDGAGFDGGWQAGEFGVHPPVVGGSIDDAQEAVDAEADGADGKLRAPQQQEHWQLVGFVYTAIFQPL